MPLKSSIKEVKRCSSLPLLAWGMKDIAFREKELKRWMELFPAARVIRYEDAGHFLSEEKPA